MKGMCKSKEDWKNKKRETEGIRMLEEWNY